MIWNNSEDFLGQIEEALARGQKNKIPFARFLEEKMDVFDYSNTALAKKVYHRSEKRKDQGNPYQPVTRQAIGTWLRGALPSSRDIYVTLGLAFQMSLEEINHVLLETYMGYGLYCKNIDDALWIALINGLFDISRMDQIRGQVEQILAEESEDEARSLATTDLWILLSEAGSLEDFFQLIRSYREEFRAGNRQFGQCLAEVIEEEYGYYDKASWFLRDIGLGHYEAQFSKIKAGKAVVTRDWLLRFMIALQPSYESIEKLLAKAQMEPLGITPAEVIIEMVAKYKSDSAANSQQIWQMIESAAGSLRKKGYEMDEDICRKYHAAYELSVSQKRWFSLCLGAQLRACRKDHDYGYEKHGYCRYTVVDRVLFEEVNRCKKSTSFRNNAVACSQQVTGLADIPAFDSLPILCVDKNKEADALELEKFEDYCFERKPGRLSNNFQFNDVYFYSTLLFSLWTGHCFIRDKWEDMLDQMKEELDRQGLTGDLFMDQLVKVWNEEEKKQVTLTDLMNGVISLHGC